MMRSRTFVRSAGVVALVVAIVAGGGYASNAVSRQACFRYALNQTPREILKSTTVFAYRDFTPGSLDTWDELGTKVKLCNEKACFPWVGMRSPRSLMPFVAELEWGYGDVPLAAKMARTKLLCLFGWVIPLSERGSAS
jgi:hypothetical protein